MPALKPTGYYGTITWLGVVADSTVDLRAKPINEVHAGFEGFEGEWHSGLTRPSCARTAALYPKGTEIRNVRQLSILSAEELALIAAEMGLVTVDPAHLGTSMVIEGIPDFSHVPPSSRLQGPSGVTITVDMENRPCTYPGAHIEKDAPGHGRAFKGVAKGRRGVTAWIEREGRLVIGDKLRLFVPDQPAWRGD